MFWRSPLRAVFIALCTAPVLAAAQTVVEYDHAAGGARLKRSATDTGRALRNGATLKVRPGETVRVRVLNANTAFYNYSARVGEAPAPEIARGRVGDFLKQFRPYLPEVALAIAGPAVPGRPRGAESPVYHSLLPASPPETEPVRNAWIAGRATEAALASLDDKLYGSRGLHQSSMAVLATLELMRAGGDVEQLSRALSDSLALTRRGCLRDSRQDRLPLTTDLVNAVQHLMRARRSLTVESARAGSELYGMVAHTALRDSLHRIGVLADTAVAHYEDIVESAYAFERLALPIAHACASWDHSVAIGKTPREVLQFKADARAEPEVARLATRTSAISITLESMPSVITSFGASLLVAPDATFPLVGTRAVQGGVEIFENGVRDARFNWGVTFGLGWRVTSGLAARGIRLWAPELTITPATEIKTLGAGGALSVSLVKIGAGVLWVRHAELLGGQTVGATIPTKDHLKVGDAYGKGKFYVSLSIFDIPPFK